MSALHLASPDGEPDTEPAAGPPAVIPAAIPGGSIFSPGHPAEFLRCVAFMHSWKLWRSREHGGTLDQALWCDSCTAERFDSYGPAGNLQRRAYTYPEGYSLPGYHMGELRFEAKRELARRGYQQAGTPDRDPAGWDE